MEAKVCSAKGQTRPPQPSVQLGGSRNTAGGGGPRRRLLTSKTVGRLWGGVAGAADIGHKGGESRNLQGPASGKQSGIALPAPILSRPHTAFGFPNVRTKAGANV